MKSGRAVTSLAARDRCKSILRTPRWEDLGGFLELVNSLVNEKAEISRNERATWEEEIDFLARVLSRLERNEAFYLVAEAGGEVVAVSEMPKRSGHESHVGVVGIAIRRSFRGMGIGTEMMKRLTAQATTMGLKVLTLAVFAANSVRFTSTRKQDSRILGGSRRSISGKADMWTR